MEFFGILLALLISQVGPNGIYRNAPETLSISKYLQNVTYFEIIATLGRSFKSIKFKMLALYHINNNNSLPARDLVGFISYLREAALVSQYKQIRYNFPLHRAQMDL